MELQNRFIEATFAVRLAEEQRFCLNIFIVCSFRACLACDICSYVEWPYIV